MENNQNKDLENKDTSNQHAEIQDAEQGGLKAAGLFIWDLLKVVIISLAIIIPIRYYVAQPFIVSGSSMEPNFHNNEYLIINELSYHYNAPQRGDIIVFKYPKDTSQYFIKRIIGLPGEEVQVVDNHVTIYNKQNVHGMVLDEPYLPAGTPTEGNSNIVTLGSDQYFVLGDNRTASSDSRFWGSVPKDDIVGKVFLRVFPLQSFKEFSSIQYQ